MEDKERKYQKTTRCQRYFRPVLFHISLQTTVNENNMHQHFAISPTSGLTHGILIIIIIIIIIIAKWFEKLLTCLRLKPR